MERSDYRKDRAKRIFLYKYVNVNRRYNIFSFSRKEVIFISRLEECKKQVEELSRKLEEGVANIVNGDNFKDWLDMQAKFPNYSFQNTLLILMQNPDASAVCGFQKWKQEFDRSVKKGEKGLRIFAPHEFKQRVEKNVYDEHGQQVLNDDGTPKKETVLVKRISFHPISVFDVSQTEGKPLPSMEVPELIGNTENFDKMKFALTKISPVPIIYENIENGSKGYFSPMEQKIAIKEGLSQVQEIKTLAHEIAHSLAHDKNNKRVEGLDDTKYRHIKEIEAESSAYIFCQHFGIETGDYSFNYVAAWGSQPDTDALKASMDNITKISSKMIMSAEEALTLTQTQSQTVSNELKNAPENVVAKNASKKKSISIDIDR